MSETIVTLKKGEGRTLKAGGMWVFDNEIESITGRFENGSIVTVHDFDGYPMGRGFINQNSRIRIRLMTRNVHQEIDHEFLRERVKTAWEYRKKAVDTGSCRVIFGEADFLPGLVIDKFSDVLVEFRTQAPDHPILWAADESYYLKFYIFQVVDEK